MNTPTESIQAVTGTNKLQRQKRRLQISSLVLLIFAVVLLASSLHLGRLANKQMQTLEANAQVTENIINANVRTIGQVQRELLRLVILLEAGENDPEALLLQQAFVSQRMQEATLSYQLQTLGTANLLEQSQVLAQQWTSEASPLMDAIIVDPADDDTDLRREVIGLLKEMEFAFNQLISQGEINRKKQAGQANKAILEVISSQRIILTGLGILIIGVFLFMGVTAIAYYRFDKERSVSARQLLQLNSEMQKLSKVASHTDNLVIIMDAQGRTEWVNDAFSEITGYHLAEVIGQYPFELLRGADTDPETLANLQGLIKRGEPCNHCEAFTYSKTKDRFWMALELLTIEDEQGHIRNFVAIMTDLTLQRERELKLASNSQLLDVVNQAQNEFILTNTPGIMFETLLDNLLAITESEYGFIGEVLKSPQGDPYLKTHAITNIAWSVATHKMYEQQAAGGMEFHNLKTLFGAVLTNQEPVIANKPATDSRRGGMPAGHPAMNAFLGIPFFNAQQEMVGMVGIANRPGGYDDDLVSFLQPFLATCGNLIEAYRNEKRRQATEAKLSTLNKELEQRTAEMTDQRDFALQIMNNMGQGLTVVDENGRFTFVNPAFAKMVNAEPEELIGRTPDAFTLPSDHDALLQANIDRREGQISAYGNRLKRTDGQLVDVLITGVPRYRQGKFVGSIAVVTDLTEQKRVEAALRASETEARKLSQVASRTDNMVIIADAAGYVEWVNAAFTRVTGYTLDEMIGQRPGDLLQGAETDPETVAFMRQQLLLGKGFNTEIINFAKNGRQYWVAIEVQPVHNEQGELINFIALESDITERRQAELHLRQAKEAAEEAARAKSSFLASMSHEIRTPLNGVIGLTSLLLNTDLSAEQLDYVATARKSGRLLQSIVNDILDFSALETGRIELEKYPVSLVHTLDEVIDLLQNEAGRKNLTLQYDLADNVPVVIDADGTRLRQILINLINNGIKFTETGGVAITVSSTKEKDNWHRLHFQIADTGIGIAPERQERLFKPFSQVDSSTSRKYGGSGLGLAICHQLVTYMNGRIWVESEPNKGATFHFTLPAKKLDKRLSPPISNQKFILDENMGQANPLRILIAEDDSVNQKVALHMLRQMGYRADVVANGHEVLAVLRQQPYDVILMDIQMPFLDGLTATQQIRSGRYENQPYIIAVTASALEGDRERFLAAGMDDYISKPFMPQELARALRQKRVDDAITPIKTKASPASTGAGNIPIDIAEFATRMGPDQDELLLQLAAIFIREAKPSLVALQTAVAQQDWELIRTTAHQLKGSSYSIAALHFGKLALTMEKMGREETLTGIKEVHIELMVEFDKIRQWHDNAILNR